MACLDGPPFGTLFYIHPWDIGSKCSVSIFRSACLPEPGMVDPEPAAMLDAVDPEPAAGPDSADCILLAVRMWFGFEPESISDAQLLASLGLGYPGANIPDWVVAGLGVLVARGDITVNEFKTVLEYVLDNA